MVVLGPTRRPTTPLTASRSSQPIFLPSVVGKRLVISYFRFKNIQWQYITYILCKYNVLNSTFRKIFVTTSYDIANECIVFFNCLVFETIYRRKLNFLTKLHASETGLCTLFAKQISDELAAVYECVHAMNISSA